MHKKRSDKTDSSVQKHQSSDVISGSVNSDSISTSVANKEDLPARASVSATASFDQISSATNNNTAIQPKETTTPARSMPPLVHGSSSSNRLDSVLQRLHRRLISEGSETSEAAIDHTNDSNWGSNKGEVTAKKTDWMQEELEALDRFRFKVNILDVKV